MNELPDEVRQLVRKKPNASDPTAKPGETTCIRCYKRFMSVDKSRVKICPVCKEKEDETLIGIRSTPHKVRLDNR